MVSLLKLAEITEEGVKFESPHDGSEMMLTPEKSTEIQNAIGRCMNVMLYEKRGPMTFEPGYDISTLIALTYIAVTEIDETLYFP